MKQIVIATHDGVFQADDVAAVALLKQLYPEAKIVRSRNNKELAKADIRVDVGMKYMPPTDFDHHQIDFNLTRKSGIPYASCGLVALHFRKQLFGSNETWRILDKSLFSAIDANDNALNIFEPILEISLFDVSRVIITFRPTPRSIRNKNTDEIRNIYDRSFFNAVNFFSNLLQREIQRIKHSQLDRSYIKKCIKNNDSSILVLSRYASWKPYIRSTQVTVVVFPNELNNSWIAQTVPTTNVLFPEVWAGKKDNELVQVCGIETASFCHKDRFLCSALSREGAIEMARRVVLC